MLLSQHTVVGMAIGLQTGNPYYGFLGGLVAHPMLDRMPHLDYNIISMRERETKEWAWDVWLIACVDVTVSLSMMYYVGRETGMWSVVILGAFGGALPDMLLFTPVWGKYFKKTPIGKWYDKFHDGLHGKWDATHWGLASVTVFLVQIAITIGGLWICLRK